MKKLSITTKPIFLLGLLLVISTVCKNDKNTTAVYDPFCKKFAKDGSCL